MEDKTYEELDGLHHSAMEDVRLNKEIVESFFKAKQEILFKYHRDLIVLDFYRKYTFFPRNKTLQEVFYSFENFKLPFFNFGEGYAIRIEFKIRRKNLLLIFKSTPDRSDNTCLITIPLELFDSDLKGLKKFLDDFYERSLVNNKRIEQEKIQKEIERLQIKLQKLKDE